MNLRQLRYFAEVVDAGNARTAAQKLFVAPTAISMQLAQLEELLGGRLFDRASRPMALTPLGQFVYPKARELLSAASRLEYEAKAMAAGNLGWLSIGFTRSTIFSIVPEAVRALQATSPDVRIELVEILTEDQAASLRSGAIHVGLARVIGPFTREPDLQYTDLFDDPLVAAIPGQHPLAARETLAAADLNCLPYISYPKGATSHFARQVLTLLQAAGATPQVGHEAKEIHTALGLVAAGLGTTVVGRSVAANNRTDVRFLPIVDLQTHSKVLAVRNAGATNLHAEAFLRIVQSQVRV
ncbi:MAG: LysR family transcriptional regulator [Ramlibacter sp.]